MVSEPQQDDPSGAGLPPSAREGPFLQAMSRQMNLMRHVYADQATVGVDFLFVTYLSLCAQFGRFAYGPITIECRVVEEIFERTYRRLAPGEKPGGYDDSGTRFYQCLGTELADSKSRRVDELHWLLAFMRMGEGLPGKVFGELGVTPEQVEQFARGEPLPARPAAPEHRGPAERLYSPEEVADYLGVHVQTVRIWIRNGRLPARRLAGQRALRIRESDLDAVLEPLNHGEASE